MVLVIFAVAPFAGAWIEIETCRAMYGRGDVAPFAGAWIEIHRIRGQTTLTLVAPFAGAWIEIVVLGGNDNSVVGRSLRGSVD